MLGLDFGGSKIAAALCALDGSRRGERIVATDPSLGAEANLERALALARELLTASGARLAGVGAVTFGIPLAGGVDLAPAVPGWDRLPIRQRLEEALGASVTVLTDVKAAAVVEARDGALAGANPGLYLNLGTGLAAAIVVDGKVMTGAHGASGEIGYNLRATADVWAAEGTGRLLLEEVVSGMALTAAAARLPSNGHSMRRGDSGAAQTLGAPRAGPGADEVFERAADEPAYQELLSTFVRELAFHLVNLVVAVDPARVAVGGGMVRSWHLLEAPLRSALDAHVPYPPELVPAAFPYDAALRGALHAGLEMVRSNGLDGAATGQAGRYPGAAPGAAGPPTMQGQKSPR